MMAQTRKGFVCAREFTSLFDKVEFNTVRINGRHDFFPVLDGLRCGKDAYLCCPSCVFRPCNLVNNKREGNTSRRADFSPLIMQKL